MPSKKFSSPFAPAFTSAINRGTPCWTAVHNIANRTGKSPTTIFNSLCKANLCFRQKVNGQWIYWPCNMPGKSSSKNVKCCQTNMWQWFVEWCLASGCCTPNQMHSHCGSQPQFMNFCRKFWNHQFTGAGFGSSTSGRKSTARKSAPRSYKFPTLKSTSSTTRRYRKVA